MTANSKCHKSQFYWEILVKKWFSDIENLVTKKPGINNMFMN